MAATKIDADWFDFYKKFINEAVHDVGPNQQGVDLNLTQRLVEGSPKQAQVTIQALWGERQKLLREGNPKHLDLRLHCCSLMTAYCNVFGLDNESTAMIFKSAPGLQSEFSSFLTEQERVL